MLHRKSVETLRQDAASHGLHRSLGAGALLLFGLGCILGAGVYVMPGVAAAHYAGPAVIVSFAIAGCACGMTALCYAELASTMPVAGSAYTYCYASMGEVFAWSLGWLLLLEYTLSTSLLAVGFSGYLVSLLHDFGLAIPVRLVTPTIASGAAGQVGFTGGVDLLAGLAVACVAGVLAAGVRESARVNGVLVAIKVVVLVGFVAVGSAAIRPENWTPFVPPNEGGFTYGWPGVLRAASLLFFAYLGFETVSTAASEARNPKRDIPIGILGALAICTVIYMIVATVLTGVAPFRTLGAADPIAVAVNHMNMPGFAIVVKMGALTGLASVLLVTAFGQSRIAFAMSRDGLLPQVFSRLSVRAKAPVGAILGLGAISTVSAAMLPISLLADLVSLSVAFTFCTVAITLMWLRTTQPDLPRPFRVPFGGVRIGRVWLGVTPLAAIVMCLVIMAPVFLDLVSKAVGGDPVPLTIVLLYAALGAGIYGGYGLRAARLAQAPQGASEDGAPAPLR